MEYITVECMNQFPHDPHTWREGFLWRHKKTCGGVPQWFKEFHVPEKRCRHDFKFMPEESDSVCMTWLCKKCLIKWEKFRSLYRFQTRARHVGRDGYSVVYKKQKI
jgi:hypothetical protein